VNDAHCTVIILLSTSQWCDQSTCPQYQDLILKSILVLKAKASGFEAEAKAAASETADKTEAVDPEEQGQGSKAAGWLVCRV